MNNFERIKQMSVDEMAIFLRNDILYYLPCKGTCEAQKECQFACLMMMREYLLQEVEE